MRTNYVLNGFGIRCINCRLGLSTFLMISVFQILLRSYMAVILPVRRKTINKSINQSIKPDFTCRYQPAIFVCVHTTGLVLTKGM